MAKVNLGQTRLTHVSKSYTLPECTNKRGDEGTFYMVQKRELFQWIELQTKFVEREKKINNLENSCNKM